MNVEGRVASHRLWGLSFLLVIPAIAVYVCHFLVSLEKPELIATGFIHYDMPYYVANALEYQKSDSLTLAFSLPYTDSYVNDRIYFYPHLFFLGVVMRYTALPPVVVYLLFGLLFSVLTLRIGLQLVVALVPMRSMYLVLVACLFAFGGGLFFLAGFITSWLEGLPLGKAILLSFRWDPGSGWWFLNLGRNFLFPMEAYYHFVFLSTVYLVYQKKYLPATLLTLLMAASHPFTGSALLTIMLAWYLMEILLIRQREIAFYLPVVLTVGLLLFLYYNFIFLPSHEEHRVLMKQWTIDWSTGFFNYLIGYVLVLVPAVLRLGSREKIRAFVQHPFHRFLLVWLFVNVALENHELFMKSLQPLHFTRGYVWINLFLIGLPVIHRGILRLWEAATPVMLVAVPLVAGIAISDNAIWFAMLGYGQLHGGGVPVSRTQREVLVFLRDHARPNELLVSQDERIGYLSLVYTPYRSYLSHPYNTPYVDAKRAQLKAWFEACDEPDESTLPASLWVSYRSSPPCAWLTKMKRIFYNDDYEVWRVNE